MTPMGLIATDEILDAVEHLPNGATLVFSDVSWEDYERILDAYAERPHLRVSYDRGTLEIMSPSNRHGRHVPLFDLLVFEFARRRKIPVEMLSHTTWKKRALAKGVEADCCYFITNAAFVAENYGFDVEVAPPPDIAVEIDVTTNSRRKFSIYAALLVPEIWLYDGRKVQIYQLIEDSYLEIDESRFLPGLTGAILSEYIELSKTQGQTKTLEKFARRVRKLK